MPEDQSTKTEVEIFGSVYTVRAGHDPEHLQELAAKVDRDMREIASRISTVDTAKIAILAALNIADELFESQRRREGPTDEITERMVRLSETLDEALVEGS
ncbi:MAG: cell division protein ZapA [Thermoanaerobaculia bacterium]|nr:cell division protein ZapA [Thermoanaerobaculia bacterium]